MGPRAKRLLVAGVMPAAAVALCVLAMAVCRPAASADQKAIAELMQNTWSRPGAEMRIEAIAVAGGFAVADWIQADMGGRALLERDGGAWKVTLCGGKAIATEPGLRSAGAPAPVAHALARKLSVAELRVAPDNLARVNRFAGEVRMAAPADPTATKPQSNKEAL